MVPDWVSGINNRHQHNLIEQHYIIPHTHVFFLLLLLCHYLARTVRENDRKWVGDKDEERSRSMSVGYRLGVGMGMATA